MDALFALPYGPVLIFAMRIIDVALGAVRTIVMVRGQRGRAAAVGFLEVLIWVLAVGQALQHVGSAYHVVGYAGGFAVGTYVGTTLGQMLTRGTVVVRAILPGIPGGSVARHLREEGYGVTEIEGKGRDGPLDIVNTVVSQAEAPKVVARVEAMAPGAFITVEEVRTTRNGMLTPPTVPHVRVVGK